LGYREKTMAIKIMSSRLYRIRERDGQTDRQTDRITISCGVCWRAI